MPSRLVVDSVVKVRMVGERKRRPRRVFFERLPEQRSNFTAWLIIEPERKGVTT